MLSGRGVTATAEDIMVVVNACKPYLIAIACILAALVLIYIATIFVKKHLVKATIRRQSVVAALIAVVVVVNMICYGPVNTLLNVSMAAGGELSEDLEAESYAVA